MSASNKKKQDKNINKNTITALKAKKRDSHILEKLRTETKVSLAKKILEQIYCSDVKASAMGKSSDFSSLGLTLSQERLKGLIEESRLKIDPLRLSTEIAGQIIRERRKELKLSQQDVGDAVNLSLNSIVKIENGDSDCKISNFFSLCYVLGIKISLEIENENE